MSGVACQNEDFFRKKSRWRTAGTLRRPPIASALGHGRPLISCMEGCCDERAAARAAADAAPRLAEAATRLATAGRDQGQTRQRTAGSVPAARCPIEGRLTRTLFATLSPSPLERPLDAQTPLSQEEKLSGKKLFKYFELAPQYFFMHRDHGETVNAAM